MLSRNREKFILSLQKRKIRDDLRLFVIEGDKIVREFLLSGRDIRYLIAKPEFISGIPVEFRSRIDEIIPVSYGELKKVSSLKTPHNAMAIVPMPEVTLKMGEISGNLTLALDTIQDPGNLGTIIRAAAWFGIRDLVCSETCVDVYNPKTVQATMGAIMHVNVHYTGLEEFLAAARNDGMEVFGTMLEGEPVYGAELAHNGVILLGNESRGISGNLIPLITRRLTIPGFNPVKSGIDSLNAGMAASIMLSEFARRKFTSG